MLISQRRRPAALAGVLAAGTVTVGWVVALAVDNGTSVLTAAFLIAAPALAVAVPVRGVDGLARVVLGAASAVSVNGLVAQTMLAIDQWSVRGGVVVVAVISAIIGLAIGTWCGPPGAAVEDRDDAGDPT